MADQYIGKKFDGRYEIKELIGVGGMANVYKGYDILEDEVVAIKILREEYSSSEDFLRRFKNESKAISLLSHPNIVKVFDVSITERVQYLVMEYIDGITLKEFINQKGALPWKDAVHFIVQILRALQHAHDMGVVHRDIKPQNIMLLEDGSIKVMDFGIARLSRSQTRTMTDKAIGSVHYISPEQAKGDVTDAKTDIYSAGVILFEMLTGQLPFQAETAVSVAIKQIADEPVKPRDINPDIPEGLEEITLKAMQKNAEKRYQSASSMLIDIDEFKRNPSISFEYNYFTDEEPTKYIDTIQQVRKSGDGTRAGAPVGRRKKVSSTTVLLGIAAACVLFMFVALAIMFFGGTSKDVIAVPDFVGMKATDVEQNREYNDNFSITWDYKSNDEVEAGEIYKQSVVKEKKVKKGEAIVLTVSTGKEEITLEDYTNQMASEVQQTLQQKGLIVKLEEKNSTTVEAGKIIRTTPGAGVKVKSGDKVTIVVSKGEEAKIAVPSLAGTSQTQAMSTLQSLGLKVGRITSEYSDTVAAGNVISQDPQPGSNVNKGTTVSIVVSKGKRPVTPPPTTDPGDDGEGTSTGRLNVPTIGEIIRRR